MKKFTLNIDIKGAAMVGESDWDTIVAIADLLRKVSSDLHFGHREGILRDVNGNTVGNWGYVE